MNTPINKHWSFRRLDDKNWTIERLSGSRWNTVGYYGSLEVAALRALDKLVLADGPVPDDLHALIKAVEAARAQIERALRMMPGLAKTRAVPEKRREGTWSPLIPISRS